MIKIFTFFLLSFTMFGCNAEQSSTNNAQSDDRVDFTRGDALIKWQDGLPLLNLLVLGDYYQFHELGSYPMGTRGSRATAARALELAMSKGFDINPNYNISFKSRGTVPVVIILDDKQVPLTLDDFRPKELEIVRFTLLASDTNSTVEDLF